MNKYIRNNLYNILIKFTNGGLNQLNRFQKRDC